jgi:hypothetical protein
VSWTTHVTVAEQHVCCTHAVQASELNEMPDALRSHAPPVPDDAPPPLLVEPLEPPVVVLGSGASVGVEVDDFDEHANSSVDARRPTPHDSHDEERMRSTKHATCPSADAVFSRLPRTSPWIARAPARSPVPLEHR